MKRATPATAAYKKACAELMNSGWRLTNYGKGLRYFAKSRGDGNEDIRAIDAVTGKVTAEEVQDKAGNKIG